MTNWITSLNSTWSDATFEGMETKSHLVESLLDTGGGTEKIRLIFQESLRLQHWPFNLQFPEFWRTRGCVILSQICFPISLHTKLEGYALITGVL